MPSLPTNLRSIAGITRLIFAFFRRDFWHETSYRLSFLLSFFSVFFNVFTFYFLSRTFDGQISPTLEKYNADYFPFVLIGVAFNAYFSVGLTGFARAIRSAQNTGTLEAMIMTPAPLSVMVVGSALWSYAFTTFRIAIYLGLGMLLGIRFAGANLPAAALTITLAIIAFASIGILSAGIIMVIKRGDPVTTFLSYFTLLLGGIYYPIEVLPGWLQTIAKLLPVTYALDAMRLALLKGAGWGELRTDLVVLALFCLVLLPISLLSFRLAVNKARTDGSLTHY